MSTTRRGIVTVSRDESDRLTVSFHYDPQLVEKVKTVHGYRWHKDRKYWSFPDSDGTLEKILETLEGEEIHIDPALQAKLLSDVIARSETPHMSLRGTKSRGNLISSGQASQSLHSFDDLRREFGHANSKTTEIYTHVSNKALMKIQNPLDQIFKEKGGGNL